MSTTESGGQEADFRWPDGKRAAFSMTFDDGRLSQADRGLPILDARGLKATFYVGARNLVARQDQWRGAVANGHEIGNQTMTHPCSGNFPFARANALEDLTLARMEEELKQSNDLIQQTLGVRPQTFAYPCAQKFVGRGTQVKSYVPLVARHFIVGRGAHDETHNHPLYCDLAQVYAMGADGFEFQQLKVLIDSALAEGGWLIFHAHDVGESGKQTMLDRALDELCAHVLDPDTGLWADTVAAIGRYVQAARKNA